MSSDREQNELTSNTSPFLLSVYSPSCPSVLSDTQSLPLYPFSLSRDHPLKRIIRMPTIFAIASDKGSAGQDKRRRS